MDKSLDEIISSRPKGVRRGSRRSAGRQAILGTGGTPAARAKAVVSTGRPAPSPQTSDKIMVSNLPPDVNEQQIKELFHTTVGPLREVTLHYDSNGRSKGIAAVHFQKRGDGTKAYEQYNNRLIDSKRPMRIEIVVDPSRAPPPPLASRVAPAPGAAAAAAGSARGAAVRGGRRGGKAGTRPRKERVPKSAADLDAEMEDYTASNAATTA